MDTSPPFARLTSGSVVAVDAQFGFVGRCDTRVDALLRKWLAILLGPFTDADRDAGYRYDLSILLAELSLTQMLDAPSLGMGRSPHRRSAIRSLKYTSGQTRPEHRKLDPESGYAASRSS
ncbi:hypothetical protein [Rhodococcus jostii]|uniref:hypothetical protein n=1 Tax=Rhodococcus jostii TaxID=132919 RepID=UPI0009335067|nr:hypothetical protein [Rhodococcus jostii]